MADPGRLIARVELRKDNVLYLNDGTYGGLIEAANMYGFVSHTHHPNPLHVGDHDDTTLMPFRFCGPTCDSVDMMDGPFLLPADIAEGDWIDIRKTGAYSAASSAISMAGKTLTLVL